MRAESVAIPLLRALSARPRLTDLLFARDPWGNPFSDETFVDPFPMVRRMWEDGPVTYKRFWGRWFVIGYDECQTVVNHPAATAGADMASLLDEVRPYSRLAPETKRFFRDWLLLQDPPEHTRLRRLVSRPFTPRRIEGQVPLIESAVDELLAAASGAPTIDLAAALNRPLPVRVISSMLGLPSDRWTWASETVATLSTFLDPIHGLDVAALDRAVEDFRSVVADLAAERRRRPTDDLISALVQPTDDGSGAGDGPLTDNELAATVGLLIVAGHDTTTLALGNAQLALAANPDQRALVRDDPSLWPNAVEELLRYDTSVVAVPRRSTAEIPLGPVTIPAGAPIMVELQAANRDPRRWDDPHVLRLDRPDPRPISFGHGVHHCLGHALARTELRVALAAVVERLGDYTVEPGGVDWRRSGLLRGPTRLVVRPGRPGAPPR